MSKNNILYRFQSGFWKNYSINTCLRHLTEKITTRFEKDLFTGMILTDLQKAFDTIDHQILIKKMKYLDFLKNVIARFKSYLSELSKFKTNISTSYSSPSNLIYDVPQGSILGPLLFLLCINNFIQAIVVTLWKWYLHKNVTEIEKQLLKDFSSLCDWFVDNKLSAHFGQNKTKSILFGTKHKLRSAKVLNIVYNGIGIKQYEKVKYLGCVLDQSVSGESVALNVIDKVNSRLKFRHRQNRFLTPLFRRLFFNALFFWFNLFLIMLAQLGFQISQKD